jgi:polyhydroxyalkanoate synthesis regulator phasin
MRGQFVAYVKTVCVLRCKRHLARLSEGCNFTSYKQVRQKMEATFKKIDKDFLLSDSSLNSYKYRLLTAGYLLEEFAKNPIGYFMHGTEEFPREQGVLVRWENLRVDGDKVYGKPCINLNHPRGQRTVNEIESGFLNAASFGHFVVLEVSDKPEDYLEGQEGPTVSKWFNRECSLVDVPGNYNALTELFDKDNNPLKIADLIAQQKIITMDKIFLTTAQLQALNATADANAVDTAIKNLVAEAAKVPQLTQDLAAANTAKKASDDALVALKATVVAEQVKNLVDTAVADGKLTKEAGETLAKDYATNPDGLKNLVAKMPKYTSLAGRIEGANEELTNLMAKSYDELDKAGTLERLKALDEAGFQAKYKEKFGKEYGK